MSGSSTGTTMTACLEVIAVVRLPLTRHHHSRPWWWSATAAREPRQPSPAARESSDVLLLEKMDYVGGNSVLSAGYMRVADDADDAAAYLDSACGGRVDWPVVETLAHGMTELMAYLEELAKPACSQGVSKCGQCPDRRRPGGPV